MSSEKKKSKHNRQLSRAINQKQQPPPPPHQRLNDVNRQTVDDGVVTVYDQVRDHDDQNDKRNPAVTIDIEEELARLDLETLDDLVYSLGIFDKDEQKEDKTSGKSGGSLDKTSLTHQKQKSLKEQSLQKRYSVSITDSVEFIRNNLDSPSPPTISQTILTDSGVSSGVTQSSIKALFLEPASLTYGTLFPDQFRPLINTDEMDKKKKGAKVVQANGVGQGPSGPSGSRNHLISEAMIPGSIKDTSILQSDLISAVEQNKVDKVRRILASGVDPNSVVDTSGRWPLHVAALHGHTSIVKILLDFGAQKDQPDTNLERTPLLYAAASSPETVQVLLNYRADINSRNKFGANALHYSAGAGQGDCCRLLAASGCDVNSRDRQKMTPLHMAARVDDILSIEVLLEYGADIHAKDCFGKTALHHAAETCEGMESDYGKMGATFRKLISAGITVNATDGDGKTALYYAIQTGSPDAVTILSELGAELLDGVSLLSMGRKFPALIRPFLDKCVSSNIDTCDAESKHFYIQFDYTCLTFFPKDIPNDKLLSMQSREETESVLPEAGVLHGLTRCKDTSILSHPVCESLLRLKWKKVKWYLYLDMLLFAVFLAFLTAVIFMEYESDSTAAAELESNMTMDNGNGGGILETPSASEALLVSHRSSFCMDSTRNIVIWSILWVLTACLGIREMIQLVQAPLHYVVQIENMLELVLVFSVGMLSLAECGVQSFIDARDHFAAVCLIVGWTIQVTLYGKIPVFGVYIRMFAAVATNILKCIFTYLGLLFAFSLTLHFLFRTHKEFDSVGFTFLKTFAMMIGEIELARTFIDKDKNTTIVPFTSHLMFALFIIFISVILMSLLVALAVCDISKMQREGEYMQLVQQVKVASQLEDALQHRSLLYPQFGMKDIRSIHQRKGVIFPNLKDHGKLSKDAMEIVIIQHTKRLDHSSGANGIPQQKETEQHSIARATNEVADDLIVKLKNKMDKYAYEVDKRSDQLLQDFRGTQERGTMQTQQLQREVLLVRNLLEDMNTCLRDLSITVKAWGERADESLASSKSRASISGDLRRSRNNNSSDATTATDFQQTTSPESSTSNDSSPEPINAVVVAHPEASEPPKNGQE